MIQVTRKDSKESTENLLRRFNRKVQQAGTIAVVKQKQYFEKPLSKRERRLRAIVRQERKAVKLKKIKLANGSLDTIMIAAQISQDLKQAMLAKDTRRVTVLRGVKSVILYAEVAAGKRDEGLDDAAIIALLQKEVKKRQESADVYAKAGDSERAASELGEKAIIEMYVPAALSEAEVAEQVDEAIAALQATDNAMLGQVIAQVKKTTNGAADGALIAKIAKEKLNR